MCLQELVSDICVMHVKVDLVAIALSLGMSVLVILGSDRNKLCLQQFPSGALHRLVRIACDA